MRSEEIKVANWLQEALGEDYIVRYDDCESGFTRVIYKPLNKQIREVPNSEMRKGISTAGFTARFADRMQALANR